MNENFDNFRKNIQGHLPGVLSFIDFADFKRRNMHLGYNEGDNDIKTFEAILAQNLSDNDHFLRYAGDKWALYLENNSIGKLTSIIDLFRLSTDVEVGWECFGKKGDESKSKLTIINSVLHRTVRCTYVRISEINMLEKLIQKLSEFVWFCRVDTPLKLSVPEVSAANKWQCVEYPEDDRHCIFCGSTDFEDLDDGCGPILEMECECKTCGAHLEYNEIFRTKTQSNRLSSTPNNSAN